MFDVKSMGVQILRAAAYTLAALLWVSFFVWMGAGEPEGPSLDEQIAAGGFGTAFLVVTTFAAIVGLTGWLVGASVWHWLEAGTTIAAWRIDRKDGRRTACPAES